MLHQHRTCHTLREDGFGAYFLGYQHSRVRAYGNGGYTEAREPKCGMKPMDQAAIGIPDRIKVVTCGLRKNSPVMWPEGPSCLQFNLVMAQKDRLEAYIKTSDRLAEGGLP